MPKLVLLSKRKGPDRVIEYLGITIDTIKGQPCVSPEKVKEMSQLLVS